MAKTKAGISKKLRFDVFKRDGFVCQYCGGHPPKVLLHCDHIQPEAEGGPTTIDNLVTACQNCNLGKGAVPLTIVPQPLADRAAETLEREEQIRGFSEVQEAKRLRIEEESWRVAEMLFPGSSKDGLSKADFLSIKRFVERLGLYEILDSAEVALARKPYKDQHYARWKYFCGTCWGKIKDLEGPKA